MKSFLNRHKELLLFILCFLFFYLCFDISMKSETRSPVMYIPFAGVFVFGLLSLNFLYRFITRKKVISIIKNALTRFYRAFVKLMKKGRSTIQRFFSSGRKGIFIKGRSKTEIAYREIKELKEINYSRIKLPKWKSLETNRERIRYLYLKFILLRISSGYKFSVSYTPDNISDGLAVNDMEKLLFKEYNDSRYGNSTPADRIIEELKENLK